MRGLLTLLVCCALLVQGTSPIKTAFFVAVSSILVSVSAYWPTSSVFPSCGVLISFSSGMMILFCYCALINSHEKPPKEKNNYTLYTLALMMTTMMGSNSHVSSNLNKMLVGTTTTPYCIGAMGLVILAMVCINKSMFTPTKTLTQSY